MQNLLEDLKNLLSKDERLVVEGKLMKNKVIELSLALDEGLLSLLLKDTGIKKYFFKEVSNTMVFDKVKFMRFVSNKSFLPDSFTSFKNKIGLSTDDDFFSERKDIVLSWPYKDCILQGGQTREDAKRNEIFWNEVLAPDEIDRLLQPKVFKNFKRYTEKVENKKINLAIGDNLIVKGNNLIVLHSLINIYRNRVKLIYIDPPYNTGTDSFGYNDSFNHSSWLTFMKNRLEIAKEYLTSDGVIFVHIGDEELHYLKVIMDEIFGRDKFIGTIPRKTRTGKSDVPFKFSQDFDWILAYTKNASPQTAIFKREVQRRYYSSPDFPNDQWRLNPITTQRTIDERPNSNFTMVNPKTGEKYPVNPNRSWAVTKDTFKKYYDENKIIFPGDYDFLNIKQPMLRVFKSEEVMKKGEDFDKSFFSSDTININIETLLKETKNKNGTDEILELFGSKVFSYPKNELLLKTLIESCTKEGDIVMDYHLGSGTTAAVAHKLKRQYIGIEQMDYIENVTVKRLTKVIKGDNTGISSEVNWEGGGDFVYMELMHVNEEITKSIESAKTKKELIGIYNEIIIDKNLLLKENFNPIQFSDDQIKELELGEIKKLLLSILDKNFIFIPFSEIEDKDYKIDGETKLNNYSVYKMK